MSHTQRHREAGEALDDLHDYFDLAWRIFTRVEREEPEKFKILIKELRARIIRA